MLNIEVQGKVGSMEGFTFANAFEKVGRYLELSIKQNFASGGRPETWQARKKDGSPSHLYISGALFNTIGFEFGEDFTRAGAMTLLPYSYIHQYGGVINHPGSSKFQAWQGNGGTIFAPHGTKPHEIPIPARPYVMFQEEDFGYINNEFVNEIVTYFDSHGETI